ncbi:S-layer homology domain-containing protein [Microbacteriaceae bacterium VKM Ac-2855]|nr:S-layer homology domain-containing protein [Microbacteriaceae bacterium VKM Ac-2855]
MNAPTFAPEDAVSRQAMAMFVARMSDEVIPRATELRFTDVSPENPFVDQIEWVAAEKLTTGYADGGFHPLEPASRQAMSAFRFDATRQSLGSPGHNLT